AGPTTAAPAKPGAGANSGRPRDAHARSWLAARADRGPGAGGLAAQTISIWAAMAGAPGTTVEARWRARRRRPRRSRSAADWLPPRRRPLRDGSLGAPRPARWPGLRLDAPPIAAGRGAAVFQRSCRCIRVAAAD